MNSNIITTWEDFLEAKEYLLNYSSEYLVIDTETDSVIENKANLYGIGLSLDEHEAFYIPFRKKDTDYWWREDQETEIIQFLADFIKSKKIIGHNIIYDILVLWYNWEIDFTDCIYSDTILQKHLLDEERPFGLKEVAVKYLGPWADKAQQELYTSIKDNEGTITKDNVQMFKADTQVLGTYCCWDVLLTRKLFDIFEPRIKSEGLYNLFYTEEIMPLYREVTIPMRKRGFNIDVEYFKDLNYNITEEINKLSEEILKDIAPEISEYEQSIIAKDYPPKLTGNFPKYAAQMIGFELPSKNGKVSLAKKGIEALPIPIPYDHRIFLEWLKEERILEKDFIQKVQRYSFFEDNPNDLSIFNINSNDHIKWLFFDKLGETPLSKTEGGKPQVDDKFIDSMKDKYEWVNKLSDYKKLNKLKSVYIEGILERQIDGIVYAGFLQFGTTSGRFSSTNPNLQNIPRAKDGDAGISELVLKYVNSIKKGFVSPKGYKIVNADYSQLEPRAFAEASGDILLQQSFINGEDLYGSIAKNIWNLDCTANEVKKKYNEYRQKAKIIALAVVYGAEAGRISQLMKIEYQEAQKIIDDYLEAYPGLKKYMSLCHKEACTTGFVTTKFGKVRHLPEAQRIYNAYGLKLLDRKYARQQGLDELRYKFKSMLNLSTNFKIQGCAAHVVNRAMIVISKEFKKQNIDGQIVATVHDEIASIVREDQAEQAKNIVRQAMENTTILSVPLKAEPIIGNNWSETK